MFRLSRTQLREIAQEFGVRIFDVECIQRDMPLKRYKPSERRDRVQELVREGWNLSEIAELLKLSAHRVWEIEEHIVQEKGGKTMTYKEDPNSLRGRIKAYFREHPGVYYAPAEIAEILSYAKPQKISLVATIMV